MSYDTDPTLGGVLGPLPKELDPPGTCHLIGCKDKGRVDHHVLGTTIGAPSEETWRKTSQPVPRDGHVFVERRMLLRLKNLTLRVAADPEHNAHPVGSLLDEARVLHDYVRGLL